MIKETLTFRSQICCKWTVQFENLEDQIPNWGLYKTGAALPVMSLNQTSPLISVYGVAQSENEPLNECVEFFFCCLHGRPLASSLQCESQVQLGLQVSELKLYTTVPIARAQVQLHTVQITKGTITVWITKWTSWNDLQHTADDMASEALTQWKFSMIPD